MDDKYIFRRISYRNDALEEGIIKEVVVLGVNVGYYGMTSVVNFPIDGTPEYAVMFLDEQRKENKEGIKKSEDWCVGKEISFFEKRRLNKILKGK